MENDPHPREILNEAVKEFSYSFSIDSDLAEKIVGAMEAFGKQCFLAARWQEVDPDGRVVKHASWPDYTLTLKPFYTLK